VIESPASGVFKLIVTEVRNFPEIAEFYQHEVVEAGQRLIGELLGQAIEAGEFRRVDINAAVHSIVLPMVMLCLVKHSVGACRPEPLMLDPHHFIRQHIDLLLRGLLAEPGTVGAAA
jgi:hypothetical protein